MAGEVLEPFVSGEPSKVDDDAQSEWVAAHAGEMFSDQVSSSNDVSGGRGADHFDVVAFPVRLAAADRTGGCFGDGVEIGDGEPKGRIRFDGQSQCCGREAMVDGPLCQAVPRGRPRVCRNGTAVVLSEVARCAGRLGCRGRICSIVTRLNQCPDEALRCC
jgi:hypothetical protein